MNKFTVFSYIIPAGAHCVDVLAARNATDAVIRLRNRLELNVVDVEVVAVVRGTLQFERVDSTQVALAPYCANSP
jgi:predicted PilT family ATPase